MSEQVQPQEQQGLTPEEQASVEIGQRGFSEPGNVNVVPDNSPQRPEWCPEQFWKDGQVDNEGLAKSYGELRGKMDGKQAEAKPEAKPDEVTPPNPTGKIEKVEPKAEEEAAPAPVTAAMEAARVEWAETQELSDDTFAALEAAGIPRPIVDLYLEGIKANSEKLLGQIHGYVGGADTYNQMIQWAGANLSAEEITAFNDALDNPALRETAVIGLQAKFSKAVPSEGKLVTINDSPSVGADVFSSRDELTAAQRDPRYATDPAYRQSVVDKLARSQAGGFQAFDRPMFQKQSFSS